MRTEPERVYLAVVTQLRNRVVPKLSPCPLWALRPKPLVPSPANWSSGRQDKPWGFIGTKWDNPYLIIKAPTITTLFSGNTLPSLPSKASASDLPYPSGSAPASPTVLSRLLLWVLISLHYRSLRASFPLIPGLPNPSPCPAQLSLKTTLSSRSARGFFTGYTYGLQLASY